ncbi:MAG: prevent-host-death protein [Thermoanaerobaculia bacterium]
MRWKISDAKQHFSEVIRAAEDEPQWIYNRERLVAAVVEPEVLREFLAWREKDRRPSLAEAFAGLRDLCAEENYEIEIPSHQDRPNPFAEG